MVQVVSLASRLRFEDLSFGYEFWGLGFRSWGLGFGRRGEVVSCEAPARASKNAIRGSKFWCVASRVGHALIQGYLAHKNLPSLRTLQSPCAHAPMVILGGSVMLMSEVLLYLRSRECVASRVGGQRLCVCVSTQAHVASRVGGRWWQAHVRGLETHTLGHALIPAE